MPSTKSMAAQTDKQGAASGTERRAKPASVSPRRPGADAFVDRVLPNSIEAEMSVLGAMLLNPQEACPLAGERLAAEDFYSAAHQVIYREITALQDAMQAVDSVTLMQRLQDKKQLEEVGGAAYLAELVARVPSAANVEHYIDIVYEKQLLRRLIAAAYDILGRAFEEQDDVKGWIDEVEQEVFKVTAERTVSGPRPVRELIHDAMASIEKMYDSKGMTGLATGFRELDKLTAGLHPGNMVVIAGRPSMGKTALAMNIAENVAIDYQIPVGVFSLEMSSEELVKRMLCSRARVNLRKTSDGFLGERDFPLLTAAATQLMKSPLYIDDTAGLAINQVRARARRMKQQYNVQLVVVDYLQLMRAPSRRADTSRQVEIADISAGIKALAKELQIPIIVLSQLNRQPESREGGRPKLSDLRESGCLAGETMVTLAASGRRVPIGELTRQKGFDVWALNEATMKIERMPVARAFPTGRKPVFRLTTRLGRSVRATANHQFRTFEGWKRLDELQVGDFLALPRRLPGNYQATMSFGELALLGHLIGDGCTLPRHVLQYTTRERDLAEQVAALGSELFGSAVRPRIQRERQWYQVYLTSTRHHTHGVHSAVADWLRELGVFGLRAHEKHVPAQVFSQPADHVARFLRHLWATDGCIRPQMNHGRLSPAIYYATSSGRLAQEVAVLLLRLRINARCAVVPQTGKGRDQHHVVVSGQPDVVRFAEQVGTVGAYRCEALAQIMGHTATVTANTNRDVLPRAVWRQCVRPAMATHGLSTRRFQAAIGTTYCGGALYRTNVSRERAARIARVVTSPVLQTLAESDVYWDRVTLVEPAGTTEVFDLTVPKLHNFVANDLFVHNSIEQDADVVGLLVRPEVYAEEDGEKEAEKGKATLIIAKQRNGPQGDVPLTFRHEFTRFEDQARISEEDMPRAERDEE